MTARERNAPRGASMKAPTRRVAPPRSPPPLATVTAHVPRVRERGPRGYENFADIKGGSCEGGIPPTRLYLFFPYWFFFFFYCNILSILQGCVFSLRGIFQARALLRSSRTLSIDVSRRSRAFDYGSIMVCGVDRSICRRDISIGRSTTSRFYFRSFEISYEARRVKVR